MPAVGVFGTAFCVPRGVRALVGVLVAPTGVFAAPAVAGLVAVPAALDGLADSAAEPLFTLPDVAGFFVCPRGVLLADAAGFAAPAGVLLVDAGVAGFLVPTGVFEAAEEEAAAGFAGVEVPEVEGFRGPSLAGLGLGGAGVSVGGSLSFISMPAMVVKTVGNTKRRLGFVQQKDKQMNLLVT